jgi:hypothetical protein
MVATEICSICPMVVTELHYGWNRFFSVAYWMQLNFSYFLICQLIKLICMLGAVELFSKNVCTALVK